MLFTPFLFPSLFLPPAAKCCGHVVQGCITFLKSELKGYSVVLDLSPIKLASAFPAPSYSFIYQLPCFEHLCGACKLDCAQHRPQSKTNNCI